MPSHKKKTDDSRQVQLLGHFTHSATDVLSQSRHRGVITRSLSGTIKKLDQVLDPSQPQYNFCHEKKVAGPGAGVGMAGFPSAATVTESVSTSSFSGSAPLNDAAASLVNLVNTAVPSISKAFSRKKNKDEEGAFDGVNPNPSPSLQPLPQVMGLFAPASKSDRKGSTGASFSKDAKGDRAVLEPKEDEKHDAVMGVLSKWINIGRGWGPRLFVLQGVSHVCEQHRGACQHDSSMTVNGATFHEGLGVPQKLRRCCVLHDIPKVMAPVGKVSPQA